jgi:hypothetical protein
MPNKFEIVQQISRGKKKGHAQITVNFQGRSVTRHIINGVGRHPDDTIPALHKRLRDLTDENEAMTRDKKAAIALLEQKKPKGWMDLAAKMQREIRVLEEALPNLKLALASVQKEDPLMVNYF